MTLLFADGFEDGTAAWTLINMALTTGRFGSGLASTANAGNGTVGFNGASSLVFGFACKTSNATKLCSALGSGSAHFSLDRGTGGDLVLFNANVVSIATAPANTIPAAAWSYVEIKATIHDTTGSVIVKVNGVTVITATNVDTKNVTATADAVRLGASSAGGVGNAYDDFYVCDLTGSVNNDFLGELTVEHMRPGSDDTAQWLGSDGNSVNNWDLVDEAGAYNGADYVASSTVGQRDLYVPVASARPITSPVLGVVVVAVAQKTDVGTRNVKLCVKEGSGGTVRQSAELGLPTSFGELQAVFERKGDGSQFTMADVNALRMGIEVTA